MISSNLLEISVYKTTSYLRMVFLKIFSITGMNWTSKVLLRQAADPKVIFLLKKHHNWGKKKSVIHTESEKNKCFPTLKTYHSNNNGKAFAFRWTTWMNIYFRLEEEEIVNLLGKQSSLLLLGTAIGDYALLFIINFDQKMSPLNITVNEYGNVWIYGIGWAKTLNYSFFSKFCTWNPCTTVLERWSKTPGSDPFLQCHCC